MKIRLLSICVALWLFVPQFVNAQKRVALLEPRSGEDVVVGSMEKAIVRGELRKAIVSVNGYDAVTRTDIDQLMKEQDFQRTGLVLEEDIHRLGQMAGADYLCVSTITKSSYAYYIEAYLIDVETGTILEPASQYGEVVDGQMKDIFQHCSLLAEELIEDAKAAEKKYEPIIETFDTNTWGWTLYTHNDNSALIGNGQLRLINDAGLATTARSNVSLPVDVKNDFKVIIRAVLPKVELFSTFGISFGENNTMTLASGTTNLRMNGSLSTTSNTKLGLGTNRSVIVTLIKQGENISLDVNGAVAYTGNVPIETSNFSVFAGSRTRVLIEDVRIELLSVK